MPPWKKLLTSPATWAANKGIAKVKGVIRKKVRSPTVRNLIIGQIDAAAPVLKKVVAKQLGGRPLRRRRNRRLPRPPRW